MSVENPKTSGLVTIRHIVMQVLNRVQDYSMRQYKRLVEIAIEGIEELRLFHSEEGLEVVYLHMSADKTVQLPSDFIDFVKVGYPLDGKIRLITRNDNILLPRTFYGSVIGGSFVADTGEAIGNTTYGAVIGGVFVADTEDPNQIFFSDHFRNGQFIGGLFGLPGTIDQAYYRLDRENRQIVFSGVTPRSEIVLEYISTGMKSDGSSMVPRETIIPLRAYILWQMVEHDMKVPESERTRRKAEYKDAVEALRSFKNSLAMEEYKKMLYTTSHQSAKRTS
jgi:hypothetical protein